MGDIDTMMIELSEGGGEAPQLGAAPASRTKPVGFIILAFVVFLPWLPWVLVYWPVMMRMFG